MKTAMKKLLSLALVVMLLVSAVPLAASAKEVKDDCVVVPVNVVIGNDVYYKSVTITDDVVLDEAYAKNCGAVEQWNTSTFIRTFDSWSSSTGGTTGGTIVYSWLRETAPADYTLTLNLTQTPKQTPPAGGNGNGGEGEGQVPASVSVPVIVYYGNGSTHSTSITVGNGGYALNTANGRTVAGVSNGTISWFNSSEKDVTGKTLTKSWLLEPEQSGYNLALYVNGNGTASGSGSGSNGSGDNGSDDGNNDGSTSDTHTVTFIIHYEEGDTETVRFEVKHGTTIDAADYLADYIDEEDIGNITRNGSIVNANDNLLTIRADATYHVFEYKDVGTITNKFPYEVYLHIYTNNKVDEPARNVKITKGIALDGRVTLAEVQNVVKNYYSASTDDGIKYDGLYLAEGNWVANFVYDLAKYTTIEDTNDMRQQREVHINVMVTNVTAKSSSSSSSTADSSNPKTGDTIYMAVTVLSLSAAALAAVYFVSKKRAIR